MLAEAVFSYHFTIGRIADGFQIFQKIFSRRTLDGEDLKENFKTGLRELIGMMKRRDDKDRKKKYCEENAERFKRMDEDTYDVICKMLNLKNLSGKKEAYKNYESEDYDMCRAFDEMVKDGEKRGEERLGSLIEKLLQNGIVEEALKASTSAKLRSKLYQEYSL